MVTLLASNPVDRWLETPIPPAGGFAYPIDAAARGVVKAAARGRVVSSEPIDAEHSQVAIEHAYYENHELKHVTSHYRPLSKVTVRAGDAVELGQPLGRPGRSTFTFALLEGEW